MPLHDSFSWTIFALLFALFIGSAAMFFNLVHRWTTDRAWTAMQEWARERGFDPRPAGQLLPPPVDDLGLVPRLVIGSQNITLIDAWPAWANAETPAHLLHRKLDRVFAAAALRPMHIAESLIDRFNLTSFPMVSDDDRFTVVAVDSAAARKIARALRTLLPPDLALLLIGDVLVLDFSARPFDTIEFDRVLTLVEQLVQHLPAE